MRTEGDGSFCTGQGGCSAEWLTIQRADSRAAIAIDTSCAASCGECEPVGCPTICPQPNLVPKGGATKTWLDGRIFTSTQCQSKTNGSVSCAEPSCAPPGKYIARMCAFGAADAGVPNGCSIGGTEPTQICTEVGP